MCQKAEMKINLPFALMYSLIRSAYFNYHQFTKNTANCLQHVYVDSKKHTDPFPSNQVLAYTKTV